MGNAGLENGFASVHWVHSYVSYIVIYIYYIATDKYLEHHLEKKSENRHSGDVLSMGFKKSS